MGRTDLGAQAGFHASVVAAARTNLCCYPAHCGLTCGSVTRSTHIIQAAVKGNKTAGGSSSLDLAEQSQ